MDARNMNIGLLSVEDLRHFTTLELLYKVVHHLNSVIELTDETKQGLSHLEGIVATILDEGLQSSVIEVLEQWVVEGRLQTIVNQAITRLNDVGISVKHFGAVGDGLADDTQAIKDALEFIEAVGGGTLIFPKGDYLWGEMVVIPSNTHIKAHGARLARNHGGSFLINGRAEETYGAYAAHSNITIEGGLWDGNVNRQTTGYNMLNFGKAENITIKDATFKDYSGGHVLDISGCRHVMVDHCKFIGFRPTTGREFAEAVQLAEHTALGFTEFGSYDHTPCYDVTVKNCFFGSSGTGATYGANGVGTHSATHNVFNHDIKIIDNVFEDAYYVAVRLFKYKNCIVRGNTFKNCSRGVAMSNVVGNSISSQDKDGVQSYQCQCGENYIIDGNIFEGCKTNAIYGSGQAYQSDDESLTNHDKIKHVIISNNIIRNGKGTNDILLVMSHDVKILNNTFDNVKRGIASVLNDNIQIEGNRFNQINTEAIYMYESDAYFPHLKGTGESNHAIVNNNTVTNAKLTGIFLNGPIDTGSVRGNMVENACSASAEANNRNGITISGGCQNLIVSDNVIKPSEGYMVYGLLVTNTCDNIYTHDNVGEGGQKGAVYNSAIRGLNGHEMTDYLDRSLNELTYCSIGDSITKAGQYQRVICQMCGFIETTNVSESGIEACQLANKIKDGTYALPNADIYTIFIGINDFRHSVPVGTLMDSTQGELTTFSMGLKSLIQECYKTMNPDKGRVILVLPYKNSDTPNFNTANEQGVKLINYIEVAKEIASFYSLPTVDLFNHSGFNTWTNDDFLSDGLHPTWEGHKRIGTMIAKEIQRYI